MSTFVVNHETVNNIFSVLDNIYINQQINKEYGYCYSLGKNHKENMILAKTWRKDQRLNLIIRSYRDGCVYYNSQETKRIISYILSKY